MSDNSTLEPDAYIHKNTFNHLWIELKHGGEIYEGADASDFPEDLDLGKEVGRYEENNEHFVFHVARGAKYNYITIRMPEEGGDTGITIRLAKWEDWQQ